MLLSGGNPGRACPKGFIEQSGVGPDLMQFNTPGSPKGRRTPHGNSAQLEGPVVPMDLRGAMPQQAWVAMWELPGLSGLRARRWPLYSCSCAASPPTPLSSPQSGIRLFQKEQPPFLCFTCNFVPKNKGGS